MVASDRTLVNRGKWRKRILPRLVSAIFLFHEITHGRSLDVLDSKYFNNVFSAYWCLYYVDALIVFNEAVEVFAHNTVMTTNLIGFDSAFS